MQARATLFSFSHFVAQFLSKAVVLQCCEVLRTMVAQLRATLKVAAGGVSIHAIVFSARMSLVNCLKTAGLLCLPCVRSLRPSIAQGILQVPPLCLGLPFHNLRLRRSTPTRQHPAKARGRHNCSPVDQNILESLHALVAVHDQHSWVLLSAEPQPAPFLVPQRFLSCFQPPGVLTSPV